MPTGNVAEQALASRILRTLIIEAEQRERAALDDAPGAVHEYRTHIRRLRATLAALRRIVDIAEIDALRTALAEWGRQLGEARDAEVRVELAEEMLDGLDVGDEPIRRRLIDDEIAEYSRLHARLVQLHAQPRAEQRARMLHHLDVDAPPAGDEPVRTAVFARVLRRAARRVTRAARDIDGSLDRFHAVRKAGRRLRYLAEAIAAAEPDLLGERGEEAGEAGRKVHSLLGDHRDAVLLAERVRRARALAVRAGEAPGVYDALLARLGDRAEECLADLDAALRRVRRAAADLV